MKNIQVIDAADNCTYSIFAASERNFRALFPSGTDVGFPDEIWDRLGIRKARPIFRALWKRPVDKKRVAGIHGTLFYALDVKKKYYPTRRESEMDAVAALR